MKTKIIGIGSIVVAVVIAVVANIYYCEAETTKCSVKQTTACSARQDAVCTEKQAPACNYTPEPAKVEESKGMTPEEYLPDVVANIGDEKVTKEEFLKEISNCMAPDRKIPEEVLKNASRQLLNSMLDKKVLLQLAAQDGVKPSKEVVVQEYEKMMKEIPPSYLEKLKEQLAAKGTTMEEYRQKMVNDQRAREGLAISKWINDKYASKIKITPEEVKSFYEKHKEQFKRPETVKASHILIRPEKDTPEADKTAKEKAEKILAELKSGKDFGTLAEAESACPSGKQAKGSLGEFPKGAMIKEFEDVAFSLKPGEISEVVKTKFGYHIIKKEAHNPSGYVQMEKVAPFIESNLSGTRVNDEVKKAIQSGKEKMKIQIFI